MLLWISAGSLLGSVGAQVMLVPNGPQPLNSKLCQDCIGSFGYPYCKNNLRRCV